MDDVEGMLTDKVGHEELSQWVEQIHKNFREQLVSLPEWDVLERLEAQAKQWATRVFVEESVDRRVTSSALFFFLFFFGFPALPWLPPFHSTHPHSLLLLLLLLLQTCSALSSRSWRGCKPCGAPLPCGALWKLLARSGRSPRTGAARTSTSR